MKEITTIFVAGKASFDQELQKLCNEGWEIKFASVQMLGTIMFWALLERTKKEPPAELKPPYFLKD